MNQDREVRIESEELRQALRNDFDELVEDATDGLNKARAGAIIADSEKVVRDAVARFRQKVYQKGVQMMADKAAKAAFSPSAQRRRESAPQQGTGRSESSDRQRNGSD